MCLHTEETFLLYSHRAKPVTERNEVKRGAWRRTQGEEHGGSQKAKPVTFVIRRDPSSGRMPYDLRAHQRTTNERNEEKRGML